MRFSNILITTCLAFSINVQADLTSYIGDLPQCGLQCLLETVPQSQCSLTNQTCICANKELAVATNICVAQNCTVIEALSVANISMRSCGVPVVSRQGHLIGTAGLGIVAFIAVVVRLLTRWRLEQGFKADDYVMMGIELCLAGFSPLGVLAAVYGFGLNIWDISPHNITMALKVFFIDELLYLAILGLCKISIMIFYLRIFPSQNFRIVCYIVISWVAIFTVLIEFFTLFQCRPISYNWEGWKGDYGSHKCANLNARAYASSLINIAQDFVVLILPTPWLLKLNVTLKKKINILIMFSIGTFICITSIIRFTKLVQFKVTTNPTWDYVDTVYWTAIETYISIIVPSLPAIRSLLSNKFPKLFGKDTQNGSGQVNSKSYERSQTRYGPSIKMSSKVASANTGDTAIERDGIADFFANNKLNLGDKLKGNVYTGVVAGRGNSDQELVRDEEVIYVSTEMKVENRSRSSKLGHDVARIDIEGGARRVGGED